MDTYLHEPGWRIAVYFAIVAVVSACMTVRVVVDAVRQRRDRFEAEVTRIADSRAIRQDVSDDPLDVLLPSLSPFYVARITGAIIGWAALSVIGGLLAQQTFRTASYTHRANGYMAQHNYQDAVGMFRLALKSDRRAGDLDNAYELALAQRDSNAGPASELRLETQIHPADVGAHDQLGTSLLQRHDIKGAIAEYTRAVDLQPYNAAMHNNLATALLQDNQIAEATREMRKAVSLAPKLAALHFNLANLLGRQNDAASAIAEYRKAIEQDSTLAPAYYDLSQELYAQHEPDQAIFELDSFLRLTRDQQQYAPIVALATKQLSAWKSAH